MSPAELPTNPNSPATGEFQRRKIITISLAHLFHDIYSSFLAPVLPLLIEKLSITYSTVGLLTIIQRTPSLLNPLVGLLVDRLVLRWLLIFAPIMTAVSMSLLGLAPNLLSLGILLFIPGLGATLFHVPAPVVIKQISGTRVGKGMSYFMLGGELARTLGPLIILGAISLWGLEGTYRLIPVGILATGLLYWQLHDLTTPPRPSHIERSSNSISGTLRGLLPILSILSGVLFFRALLKSSLTVFLPLYFTSRGASLWAGGISLAVLQLSGAGGTFLAGSLSDYFGRRTVLLVAAIANPLLMILFAASSGFWLIPILILMGFFLFASQPVLLALVQGLSEDHPGFINGIYFGVSFIISSVAAMIIGLLADFFGMDQVYVIAAILSLGAIPCVWALARE